MRPVISLVFIAVTLIAGCSGGDDDDEAGTLPKVTSTVSQSAKDTASTTTTPTAKSTAALEAEITAFFEDYIDTVNKSWTSAEALKRRRTMFKDSCRDCLAGYEYALLAHERNLTISGEDAALLELQLTSSHKDRVTFITTEDWPPGDLKDRDGKLIQHFDEYLGVKVAYEAVRSDHGEWQVIRSEVL